MSKLLKNQNWSAIQQEYDAGSTYRTISANYRISEASLAEAKKKGYFKSRSGKEAAKFRWDNMSDEERELQRVKCFGNPKGNRGGYRKNAGRGKKFKIKDGTGEVVTLQSTYELKLALIFQELQIDWVRPSFFRYKLNGEDKKYFPDFYLEKHEMYIDTKNDYLATLDKQKIEAVSHQNNIVLSLLLKGQITAQNIAQILNIVVTDLDKVEHTVCQKFDTFVNETVVSNICSCGRKISKKAVKCHSCSARMTNQRRRISDIYSIEKSKLQGLIWQKPIWKIAQDLKTARRTIVAKCLEFGINIPPKFYWVKKHHGYSHEGSQKKNEVISTGKYLNMDQVKEIWSLYNQGLPYKEINKKLGIARWTIGSVLRRESYTKWAYEGKDT